MGCTVLSPSPSDEIFPTHFAPRTSQRVPATVLTLFAVYSGIGSGHSLFANHNLTPPSHLLTHSLILLRVSQVGPHLGGGAQLPLRGGAGLHPLTALGVPLPRPLRPQLGRRRRQLAPLAPGPPMARRSIFLRVARCLECQHRRVADRNHSGRRNNDNDNNSYCGCCYG